MILKVKPLTKPEQSVQVSDDANVSTLSMAVKKHFDVDPSNQRLVFKGCPLLDKLKLITQYGIKDGDKLTLVVKPGVVVAPGNRPSNFETLLRAHIERSYSGNQVDIIMTKFMHVLSARLSSMSLDDIERLAELWLKADT